MAEVSDFVFLSIPSRTQIVFFFCNSQIIEVGPEFDLEKAILYILEQGIQSK